MNINDWFNEKLWNSCLGTILEVKYCEEVEKTLIFNKSNKRMLSKIDKPGHGLMLFRKIMVSITVYHEGLKVVPL